MRRMRLPASLLCLVLLFTPLAEVSADNTAGWAKVCALFNASGVLSGNDAAGMNGVDLAALEAANVELVSFDALSDIGRATELATRCIDAHDAAIGVGFGDSSFAEAAASIFQRAGRAFVTTAAAASSLPVAVGPGLYLANFSFEAEAAALAQFARNELDIEHLAIWSNGSAGPQSLAGLVRSAFEAAGGTVSQDYRYASEGQDFVEPGMELAGQIEASPQSIDGIFVSAMPLEVIPLVTALRQAGVVLPILGSDSFDGAGWDSAGSKLATSVYYAAPEVDAQGSQRAERFLEAYQLRYGAPPSSGAAAVAYDALRLIDDAAGRAPSQDPVGLAEALAATRGFEGVTGTVGYAGGDRVPRKAVSILRVEDGAATPIWTWTPAP